MRVPNEGKRGENISIFIQWSIYHRTLRENNEVIELYLDVTELVEIVRHAREFISY